MKISYMQKASSLYGAIIVPIRPHGQSILSLALIHEKPPSPLFSPIVWSHPDLSNPMVDVNFFLSCKI